MNTESLSPQRGRKCTSGQQDELRRKASQNQLKEITPSPLWWWAMYIQTFGRGLKKHFHCKK
ncbi:hypothetical protein ACQP3L_33260, partial [Escherichia coli]